jgi:hypothetical protein
MVPVLHAGTPHRVSLRGFAESSVCVETLSLSSLVSVSG